MAQIVHANDDSKDVKCGEIYRGLSDGTLSFTCLHCDVKYTKLSEYAAHLEDVYQLIDLSTDNDDYLTEIKKDESIMPDADGRLSVASSSANYEMEFIDNDDEEEDISSQIGISNIKEELINEEYLDYEVIEENESIGNHTNVYSSIDYLDQIEEEHDGRTKSKFKENTKLFNCQYCNSVFDRKHNQQLHLVTAHLVDTIEDNQKVKKEVCHICGLTFYRFAIFVEHMKLTHNVDSRQCIECDENVSFSDLLAHRRKHCAINCGTCGKNIRKSKYKSHLLTHIKDAYQCSMCGEIFENQSKLSYHMKVKHPDNGQYKPVICSICEKAFKDVATLQNHEYMHLNYRPFVCDVCHKDFTTKHYLHVHMMLHTGERPYQCDQCPESFRTSSHRIRHVNKIHTKDDKKFKCTMCEKAFEYPSRLKNHMISHTGERPFKCNLCEKAYDHPNRLSRHQNDIHPESSRPFKCDHCGKRFITATYLRTHTFTAHGVDEN